jgi:purine nucleosidase
MRSGSVVLPSSGAVEEGTEVGTIIPRLVIDTDPGVDDGVALTLALRAPSARVEAITVVRGNAALAQAVRNARLVVETCGADVPVYTGAPRPLARDAPNRPEWIHGTDGFGDLGFQPRRTDPDPGFGADRIVELVMAAPGAITLVTLGPLTNLALALMREPRLAHAAREVVVMGGAVRMPGAAATSPEFNMRTDPEAARIVLDAGFTLTLIPIELSHGPARFTADEVTAIRALNTPAARLTGELLGYSLRRSALRPLPPGEMGAACPDAVAMACALDRSLLTERIEARVAIDTGEERTAGTTLVTVTPQPGRKAVPTVGLTLDARRFKAMVFRTMRDEGRGMRDEG